MSWKMRNTRKLPMQPMALEVAREEMERPDELKREQDRLEEKRENEERGVDKWVNYDVSPEEEIPDELYLNDKLPVALERQRLIMTLTVPKLKQKMTSNVKAASKVHRQHKGNQPDGEDVDKNDGGRVG